MMPQLAKRKKVLHIIQSLGNGGCENMLLRTLPLLTDEFEHHIIALRELGELAPRFAEKGIPVTTVHWRGIFDVSGYRRLLSETKQFAPNTIITYLFHADMLGRIFLQKKVSAPIIPFLRTTYNHPKYLIARLFEKMTKRLVHSYLANSEAVKDFYISEIGVPAEKITVIPNGIDIDFFDSIVPNPDLRKSLNITPDDFVIICVANLHPNKGHRYLLEAFEQLHTSTSVIPSEIEESQLKKLKLLLVGEGTERKNLEQQIENYRSKEGILFLGRRTDVPQLLKISDCFVLPTLFEGMSNAIMEAMASGLPIITTDIPENKILIKRNTSGILIPSRDTTAIRQAIKIILSDKKTKAAIGSEGKKCIREDFDILSVINRLKKFYSSP